MDKPPKNPRRPYLDPRMRRSKIRVTMSHFIDDDIEVEVKTSLGAEFRLRVMGEGVEVYLYEELVGTLRWDELLAKYRDVASRHIMLEDPDGRI